MISVCRYVFFYVHCNSHYNTPLRRKCHPKLSEVCMYVQYVCMYFPLYVYVSHLHCNALQHNVARKIPGGVPKVERGMYVSFQCVGTYFFTSLQHTLQHTIARKLPPKIEQGVYVCCQYVYVYSVVSTATHCKTPCAGKTRWRAKS